MLDTRRASVLGSCIRHPSNLHRAPDLAAKKLVYHCPSQRQHCPIQASFNADDLEHSQTSLYTEIIIISEYGLSTTDHLLSVWHGPKSVPLQGRRPYVGILDDRCLRSKKMICVLRYRRIDTDLDLLLACVSALLLLCY